MNSTMTVLSALLYDMIVEGWKTCNAIFKEVEQVEHLEAWNCRLLQEIQYVYVAKYLKQ